MTPALRPNKRNPPSSVVTPVFETEVGADATDAPVAMAARLRHAGLIGPSEQITPVSTPPPVQPRKNEPRVKTVLLHDGRRVQVITEPPPPLRHAAASLVPSASRTAQFTGPGPVSEWEIDTPIHNPPPTLATRAPVLEPDADWFSWLPLVAGAAVVGIFLYTMWFGNFS